MSLEGFWHVVMRGEDPTDDCHLFFFFFFSMPGWWEVPGSLLSSPSGRGFSAAGFDSRLFLEGKEKAKLGGSFRT